ncbi:MAG: hypothetical protein AAB214_22115 [Fibrobacterota bacterium]
MRWFAGVASVLVSCIAAHAQPFGSPGRMTPVRRDANTSGFGFYEYLPKDYAADKKWPIVFFFHGTGEKGDGNAQLGNLLKAGLPALFKNDTDAISTNDYHRPFILVAPQDSTGWPGADNAWKLVEFAKTRYAVDTNRIYATGLSAGGGTTWGFINKYGKRLAAAAPICGAGSVSSDARVLRTLPIWAFHAFNDPTVALTQTLANVDRIAKAPDSCIAAYPSGNSTVVAKGTHTMGFDTASSKWTHDSGAVAPRQNLSLTIYESGGHDSWTRTYANEAFWNWLLAQRRPSGGVSVGKASRLREEWNGSRLEFVGIPGLVLSGSPGATRRPFDLSGRRPAR